jgi:hypothetical protein
MPADARSSQLRKAREGIDTGRGVLRTAGNPTREAAIGRGTFMNWYQDLGISTTEPAAKQMRTEEADFQSKVSEKRARVQEARGQLQGAWGELAGQEAQLDKAKGSIPSAGKVVGDAWSNFQSSLVPIRVSEVKSVRNNDAQWGPGPDWVDETVSTSTYYFPKDLAAKLAKEEGLKFTPNDSGGIDIIGAYGTAKKLNQVFTSQAAILESSYKEKASREYAGQVGAATSALSGQYAQLGEAKGRLSESQTQVDVAQRDLDSAVAMRQKQWDDLHNKYKGKIDKMNEIFSGLSIGKGKKNESA